jgi:hypothetical protein
VEKFLPRFRRQRDYGDADYLEILMLSRIGGFPRVEHLGALGRDQALVESLGYERFPDPTSAVRFLESFGPGEIQGLKGLQGWFLEKLPRQETLYLDLDTTVMTVYGDQEGARVGYNPAKPGRKSYKPLMAAGGDEVPLWVQLVPGNMSGPKALRGKPREELLALARKPGRRIVVRADKEFAVWEDLAWWAGQEGVTVIQTMPLKQGIQGRIRTVRQEAWKRVMRTWDAAVLPGQKGDGEGFRLVVYRKELTEEKSQQLSLLTSPRYAYQVLATNDKDLSLRRLKQLYNDHARVEGMVKEMKAFGLGRFPSGKFFGNAAHLRIGLLALLASLVIRRRWFGELGPVRSRTFLRDILMTPAKLVVVTV